MSYYLVIGLAVAALLLAVWWLSRRRAVPMDSLAAPDRLDTLLGWPPEATRVLRSSERLAYTTLRLALPKYMILAQVPICRFINVPKRNSYAEWMRRLGNQCVDLLVCDVTSQVVAVVELRPGEAQVSERVRRRLDRLARVLKALNIPLHVWNEEALPSVDAARASLTPKGPAVPSEFAPPSAMARRVSEEADPLPSFADTDPRAMPEVSEIREPTASTWFDELDSVPLPLTPHTPRAER